MSVASWVTCGLDLPAQDVKTGQIDIVFLTLIADDRLIIETGPSGQDICTSETNIPKATEGTRSKKKTALTF